MSAFAKVLILVPFVILFMPNMYASNSDPEFSTKKKIGSARRYVTTNSSYTIAGCDLKISPSTFKDILKLMSSSKTNVIDLHVWINSSNNTMNKTRFLAGIKWANEIGRTLISLIAQTEELWQTLILSYTNTMMAGVYSVNIVLTEETMRCLLPGDHTSDLDHIIFYLLMHQLYHVSGNETGYKLCRPHNGKNQVLKYNCCTIVGGKNTIICSDYSSIVTKRLPNLVFVSVFTVIIIFFLIILEYLSHYKEDKEHYKVSDSPM